VVAVVVEEEEGVVFASLPPKNGSLKSPQTLLLLLLFVLSAGDLWSAMTILDHQERGNFCGASRLSFGGGFFFERHGERGGERGGELKVRSNGGFGEGI
jgi:hypothetical protein